MFGVTDKDIQFGRQASVIFDNYSTGESTIINDYSRIFDDSGKRLPMLRVSFDFTKSLDENTNWSTGKVSIYGLTLDTFNSLGDYLETEVEVQVGYEYSTTRKLNKLFRAVLIDKSYIIDGGISVSTFNLQGYYFAANSATNGNGKIAITLPENALFLDSLISMAKQMSFYNFTFDLENIAKRFPDNVSRKFSDYIRKWKFPFGKSYYGTPKEVLTKVCKEYGLGYTINKDGDIVFFLTDTAIVAHMQELFGLTKTRQLVPSKEDKISEFNFRNGTASIVLSSDTGLLGLPTVKTKTITKQYSAVVEASEKVFSKKPVIGKVNKKGEAVIDKETGKKKLKVPKTKKVLRRSVEAVCLINTAIEPQGYVTLALSGENELSGDYRVRTVAIDGDTEDGNWNMTLSLEGEW